MSFSVLRVIGLSQIVTVHLYAKSVKSTLSTDFFWLIFELPVLSCCRLANIFFLKYAAFDGYRGYRLRIDMILKYFVF